MEILCDLITSYYTVNITPCRFSYQATYCKALANIFEYAIGIQACEEIVS